MGNRLSALVVVGALLVAGGAAGQTGPTQDELYRAADSHEWLLPNKDYAGVRFADLDQITPANASQLRPVCQFQGADLIRSQSNPLVYRGVLYVTTTYSTIALDPVSCRVKWRHDWKARAKEGNTSVKNRGVALKDGKVIRGTQDGYLIALDAQSGKLVWEVAAARPERFEAIGMTPIAFEDLVIVGPNGSEYGVKGWIGAFRLSDGQPVWKFNTIPDEGEPGADSWGDTDARLKGGGAIWTTPSLDARRGLVFVPVGNPAPDFFANQRPGANLYTNAMIVLDARTGQLQWYKQGVPHDTHDWDLPVVSPLFTGTLAGKRRDIVTMGGKDGLVRMIDRDTHEELFAVTVTTRLNVDEVPTEDGVYACPGGVGGMEWSVPSFNPATGRMVAPAVDWCGIFRTDEPRFVAGQQFLGGSFSFDPVEKSRGWLTAFDAYTGQVAWRYQAERPMLAAVTSTAGGVLFTGELTGDFITLDEASGEILYRFNLGGSVTGGVISYAVGGKQYVAVVSGMAAGFWQTQPGAMTLTVFALP